MSRVVHFEIHAGDIPRAVTFYTSLFGWEITPWGDPPMYYLIKTGEPGTPGIDGGMMQRHGEIDGQAVIAYVCTVDVEAIDTSIAKAVELGGTVSLEKMPVPGIGWLAYLKDTEGNIFGVMQRDSRAGM